MKTSTFVTALFASGVLATPVVNNRGHYHAANYQRDVVTNVVHATKVLYQNEVVYVDDDGKPYSTGVEPASTAVKLSQATPASGDKKDDSNNNNNNEQQKQQPQTTTQVTTTAAASTTTAAPSSSGGQEDPEAHQEAQQSIQNQHIAEQSSYIQQQNAGASAETSTPPTPSSSSSAASQPSPSSSGSSDSGSDDSDSGSNSGSGEKMSGEATYYTPGLGACGDTSSDSDMIAALNKDQFYSGGDAGVSNGNSNCGRKAKVTRGDKHVTVTVVDSCPGCKKGDLDLSPAAFKKLASESEGRVDIKWQWAD